MPGKEGKLRTSGLFRLRKSDIPVPTMKYRTGKTDGLCEESFQKRIHRILPDSYSERKKMHSFFYDGLKTVRPGDAVSLHHDEERHLFRILRAANGDRVMLLDGHGEIAEAEVSGREVIVLSRRTEPIPKLRLHLYLAPPRRQKMELLLKQAAELGVHRVVTFFSARSVALPAGENARSRQETLLAEACKQSGNPFLPVCDGPLKFADAVTDARTRCPLCCFGAPAVSGSFRPENLTGDCAFFVGPEGGFTEEEENGMKEAGFRPLRLGRRILRVETAAVAGLAVLAAAEKQENPGS